MALGGVLVGFGRRGRFVDIEAAGSCVDDELSCWRDVDVDGADQRWAVDDLWP